MSREIVIERFSDGETEIAVTTRSQNGVTDWHDPYVATWGADGVEPESRARDVAGPQGSVFHVVTDPRLIPHAWGLVGDRVVTIDGPLDVDQFSRLIATLRLG